MPESRNIFSHNQVIAVLNQAKRLNSPEPLQPKTAAVPHTEEGDVLRELAAKIASFSHDDAIKQACVELINDNFECSDVSFDDTTPHTEAKKLRKVASFLRSTKDLYKQEALKKMDTFFKLSSLNELLG